MNTKSFTDPASFGPGIWYKMHCDAIICNNLTLKESFVIMINNLCNNFKCMHCKPHFRKFIDDNPLERYFNVRDEKGRDVGIFKWTWEFHNAVNARLGKAQPSFEEAYNYYSNANVGVCYNCNKNKELLAQAKQIQQNKSFGQSKPVELVKSNPIQIINPPQQFKTIDKQIIKFDNIDDSKAFKLESFKQTTNKKSSFKPFKPYQQQI